MNDPRALMRGLIPLLAPERSEGAHPAAGHTEVVTPEGPSATARSEAATVVIEAGPFRWTADLPPGVGGAGPGPRPTELLLGALAASAVLFVRDTLAPQLGIHVDTVEATACAESDPRALLGPEPPPPELRNLQLTIRIATPDDEDAIGRLSAAWHERRPAALAISQGLAVATRFARGG